MFEKATSDTKIHDAYLHALESSNTSLDCWVQRINKFFGVLGIYEAVELILDIWVSSAFNHIVPC